MGDLNPFIVPSASSVRELLNCVDRNGKGIALVVGGEGELLATVTDGDIRRAILGGITPASPVSALLENRLCLGASKAITAFVETPKNELIQCMRKNGLRHLPLVDKKGQLIDLMILSDIQPEKKLPVTCVIMAGGNGLRLRPLTKDIPKPMLTIGEYPLLQRIIEHLGRSGIQKIVIAVHYLADKIIDYFGDGHAFGVQIEYLKEELPLGTAGALSLVDASSDFLLVMNGDILTNVNLESLVAFHIEQNAQLTIGLRLYDVGIPYGVVRLEGPNVKKLTEKPLMRYFVNGGIYLLNPDLKRYLVEGAPCDMTDFANLLISKNQTVVGFPIQEYWMDIGQWENYQKAQQDVSLGDVL